MRQQERLALASCELDLSDGKIAVLDHMSNLAERDIAEMQVMLSEMQSTLRAAFAEVAAIRAKG